MVLKFKPDKLLFTLDLVGTAVFALEGAVAGIRHNLDLFGVLVLAFVTALVGGVIRDILLGDLPPASLRDWRYGATAFAAGAIVFLFYHFVQDIPASLVILLDAAGLSLFAVAGTEKSLDQDMNSLVAALLGTITGVGGGTIRDILLAQVPMVLRTDVYATAALAGSVAMIVCRKLKLPNALAALVGGTVCFLVRMLSVWRHWNLPTPH